MSVTNVMGMVDKYLQIANGIKKRNEALQHRKVTASGKVYILRKGIKK